MNNIHVINLSAYKQPEVVESNQKEWVEYGANNDYFDYLIDRYNASTTNNAVISNICKLVYGRGLTATNANQKPNEYAQALALFSSEDLRKIIVDRKMLGQFALQLHYDKSHKKILKAYHIPVQLLRAEKCNKDGEIEAYYYSDNWSDTKKYEPKRINAFGFGTSEIEILYYKPYSVGLKYYSNPDYLAGLPYCELEESVSKYLNNLVNTSFSPKSILNFSNGIPSEEAQEEIKRNVINQLTGPEGSQLIVSFNQSAETKATVESLPVSDADKQYAYVAEEALRKILLSHQVTSPLLFGIATTTGFSANADELKNSAILFDNMVIKPYQDEIIEALETVLNFNGIDLKLKFKRLNILEDGELTNADAPKEDTTLSSHIDVIDVDKFACNDDLSDYELIYCEDVDYDIELILDNKIKEHSKVSNLSKIMNFVKTGIARPNTKSEQDGELFKSRYRYVGGLSEKSREFCKKMIKSNKIYRKEDIIAMESQSVNTGFGVKGADNYSIWLYKGGKACHHKWQREIYLRKSDVNSPLAKIFSPAQTRKAGEIAPTNDKRVYQRPIDMPNKGAYMG